MQKNIIFASIIMICLSTQAAQKNSDSIILDLDATVPSIDVFGGACVHKIYYPEELNQNSTIQDLKVYIKKITRIPVDEQRLEINRRIPGCDCHALSQYMSGNTLKVKVMPVKKVQHTANCPYKKITP